MAYRDPPRVPLYPVQLDFHTITDLLYSWVIQKAPGRSLSEFTGLRSHTASVKIDRVLASNLQKRLVALLVASRAGELAKPWKSEGSAALALPSVIQHSSVQKLFCMTKSTGGAFDPPTQRTINVITHTLIPPISLQAIDIHKEKVARREIGALASSKNIARAQKVVAPSVKERPQRFVRSQINFNTLDHVGHGTKVAEKSQVLDDRYSKKEVRSTYTQ